MAQWADARGAETEFARLTEEFRRELLAHCYRLLGSVDDAEDLVQETYLRAWRGYDRFEGRSSVRTWLYQIATNACLTALRHSSRRQLPSGLGGPGEDRTSDLDTVDSPVSWLQPMPDALVSPESADPQTIAVHRETLRLALIASLQYLPPRQRAVLLLRDVLAFPATEVATILGTTAVAVKSALQRARARLHEVAPTPERVAEPSEPQVRAQLEQYIAAFVNADAAGLQRLLLADTTLELLPSPTWYAGTEAAAGAIAGLGSPGDWRMIPTTANGQPAAAAYRRGPDGVHRAFGIVVLTAAAAGIARITVFAEPALLVAFGLPQFHPAPPEPPAAADQPRRPAHPST